jgi:hypothetical protein
MKINQFPDRIIDVEGKSYLYWRNSIFRNANPDFQQLIVKKHTTLGSTYGSSRNSNIQLTAYEKENNF